MYWKKTQDMKNQVALITGANRGIGFAVAQGLLEKDIQVIITSRNPKKGQRALQSLTKYGNVYFRQMDVTDLVSIREAVTFTQEKFGKLDILINNAGINYDTHQNVVNADLEEVRNTLETNLIGVWQTTQQFLPLLEKSKAANIVNVSSGSGSLADQNGHTPGYSVSKLGLNGLTLAFAQQLKTQKIVVNAVCPGWVRTDMGGTGAPRSPQKGAETIIWAALIENRQKTGKFFRDKKEIKW